MRIFNGNMVDSYTENLVAQCRHILTFATLQATRNSDRTMYIIDACTVLRLHSLSFATPCTTVIIKFLE